MANYDSNQLYPVYGFGGSPSWLGQGNVSHAFALTGREDAPAVAGVPGIMQAYREALNHTQLAGPTLFAPVISAATRIAQSTPHASVFHVLLILTDGDIHDMRETITSIVDASHTAPFSIIIVGVGSDSFTKMNDLDSDDALLRDYNGRTAARDIVQFVPFRKFQGNSTLLAREVLAELPKQITDYMKFHNIVPRPPE
jgi:hypothetical protein